MKHLANVVLVFLAAISGLRRRLLLRVRALALGVHVATPKKTTFLRSFSTNLHVWAAKEITKGAAREQKKKEREMDREREREVDCAEHNGSKLCLIGEGGASGARPSDLDAGGKLPSRLARKCCMVDSKKEVSLGDGASLSQ